MNKNIMLTILKSIGWGLLITLAVAILALIPVFNLLIIFLPVPYIYILSKNGKLALCASLAASVILISSIYPAVGVLYLLIVTPAILAITFAIRRKFSFFESTVFVSGVYLVVAGCICGLIYAVTGKDALTVILDQGRKFIAYNNSSITQMITTYKKMGMTDNNFSLGDVVYQFETVLRDAFPSILIISSIIIAFLNYVVSNSIISKHNNEVASVPGFMNWKLPSGVGKGLFGILVISLIGWLVKLSNFKIVMLTVLNLCIFIFMVQGLCFSDYLLNKWNVKKGWRILILVLTCIYLKYFYALLGVFEQIFQTRRFTDNINKGNSGDDKK